MVLLEANLSCNFFRGSFDKARMMPGVPLTGWDVAMTNKGMVLLEANCLVSAYDGLSICRRALTCCGPAPLCKSKSSSSSGNEAVDDRHHSVSAVLISLVPYMLSILPLLGKTTVNDGRRRWQS